jgi:hypothetical protein
MIKKAAILSLVFSHLLAVCILSSFEPEAVYAYFNASVHPEVHAVAASLDLDFNGDSKSIARFPVPANNPDRKVVSIVTITNQGTIPAEVCIKPSGKNPTNIKLLTEPICLSDFQPKTPAKFSMAWEILPGQKNAPGSSYEVSFDVTLKNGYLVSKELVFYGLLPAQSPTATNTRLPSPTPEASLTATPSAPGTFISAIQTAFGFFERSEKYRDSKTLCSDQARVSPDCVKEFTYGVRGEICVTNNGAEQTHGLAIFNQVEYKDGKGQYKPLDRAALAVQVEHELATKETRCFPYRIEFNLGQSNLFRTSAQVVILNHSGWLPGSKNCPGAILCAFGPTARAEFSLTDLATIQPTLKMRLSATPTVASSLTPVATTTLAELDPTFTATRANTSLPTGTPAPTINPTNTAVPTNPIAPTHTPTNLVVPTYTTTPTIKAAVESTQTPLP